MSPPPTSRSSCWSLLAKPDQFSTCPRIASSPNCKNARTSDRRGWVAVWRYRMRDFSRSKSRSGCAPCRNGRRANRKIRRTSIPGLAKLLRDARQEVLRVKVCKIHQTAAPALARRELNGAPSILRHGGWVVPTSRQRRECHRTIR